MTLELINKTEKNEINKTILSVLWSNDYEIIKNHMENEYEGFHHGFYKNIFHAYVAYASNVNEFEFKDYIATYLYNKLTPDEKKVNITTLILMKYNIPKDKFIAIVNYFFELGFRFDVKNFQGMTGTDYIKIGYAKYIKYINKKIIKELLK